MKEFIQQFTSKLLYKEEHLIAINRRVFLVKPSTKKMVTQNTIYADTYLGRRGKKHFIPSVFLLNELAKHTKNEVMVNDKGAWLFICGRNLWRDNVVSSTVKEGIALVFNEQKECLGYGRVQQKKVAIEVIFDIGDFLRRERRFKA